MELSKDSLAVNLQYKLEQIKRPEWEAHYLQQPSLVQWIKDNDYKHFDTTLENVKIAVEEAKIKLSLFFKRLSQGLSIDQALSKEDAQQDRLASTPIEYNGIRYDDISDLMREYKTSRGSVINKMKKHKIPLKGALYLIKAEIRERETLEQTSTPIGANQSTIDKRIRSGWPKKFLSYLYFSQDDLVAISEVMGFNPSNLVVLKNSGYSLEWAVDKLIAHSAAISTIPDEEFNRRIIADWDFDLAAMDLKPISINAQSFPTPVDALQHFCRGFEKATIDFLNGVNLFDIIGIEKPIFVQERNAYYTSIDDFAKAFGYEAGNVVGLKKSGLTYNDISKIPPDEIYRVGAFCFRDLVHACEYFKADYNTVKGQLENSDFSRYEVLTNNGKAHQTLLSFVS